MFFQDDDMINVIQFGTGDIGVTAGVLDEPDQTIGCVSLIPKEAAEIGSTYEHSDECVLDSMIGCHTRLVFTDARSIDVLIKYLKRCKKIMLKEGNVI